MDAKRAHLDAVKKAGLMSGAANTDLNKAPGPGRGVPIRVHSGAPLAPGVPRAFVERHDPGLAAAASPGEYDLPEEDLETEAPAVDITGADEG